MLGVSDNLQLFKFVGLHVRKRLANLATPPQKLRPLALGSPALQGGFADLPAPGQLVLGDASSHPCGVLPQVLSGLYERAVWRQSQAKVLPKVVH